jgi:hypothetical protein
MAAVLRRAVTATVNETWLILQSLLILMPMLTELVSSSLERKKRKAQSFHRYGPPHLIPQIIHCKLCFKPANARLADHCRHKCCLLYSPFDIVTPAIKPPRTMIVRTPGHFHPGPEDPRHNRRLALRSPDCARHMVFPDLENHDLFRGRTPHHHQHYFAQRFRSSS